MKRFFAFAVCALMLVAMTACSNTADSDQDSAIPPIQNVQTVPQAQEDADSVFIGVWSVTAQASPLDTLTFHEDGTLRAQFDGSTLGGVFFDDGTKLSLHISQKTIEGTYTADGDTITLTTADDVLVFTKA